MSTEETAKIKLPYLITNQSQKEISYNEAVDKLDFLVDAVIKGFAGTPPAGALTNDAYIIKDGVSAWVNENNNVAQYINGAWFFHVPFNGMKVYDIVASAEYVYVNGVWAKIEIPKMLSVTSLPTTPENDTWYFVQE